MLGTRIQVQIMAGDLRLVLPRDGKFRPNFASGWRERVFLAMEARLNAGIRKAN
jgi:hypothetical protein